MDKAAVFFVGTKCVQPVHRPTHNLRSIVHRLHRLMTKSLYRPKQTTGSAHSSTHQHTDLSAAKNSILTDTFLSYTHNPQRLLLLLLLIYIKEERKAS